MAFSRFYITSKGLSYLAKAQSGKRLSITRGAFGSGEKPSEIAPFDMETLVNPLGDLPIAERVTKGTTATITTQFSNKKPSGSIMTPFHIMEAGLYAKLVNGDGTDDPMNSEILFAYAYASSQEEADYIPQILTEYIINWPLTHSNASVVDVVIDYSLVYPTKEELNEAMDVKAVASGTGSALSITTPDGITITDGTSITIKLASDIQDNATLSANGGPAYPIYTSNGKPVTEGLASAGSYLPVSFNATTNRWYITGGGGGISKEDKTKLDGIETGANKYIHPDKHPSSMIEGLGTAATKDVGTGSNNVAAGDHNHDANYAQKSHFHGPSDINQDTNNRFVTDTEKATWNRKQDKLTFDTTPTEGSKNPVTSEGVKTKFDSFQNNVYTKSEMNSIIQNQMDATGKVQGNLNNHIDDKSNPHAVTKAQIGLGNVDNTSDANKPISTAVQTALSGKAPTNHASSEHTYGIGTKTNYGHVKLTDTYDYASDMNEGIAASPKAVKTVADKLNRANDVINRLPPMDHASASNTYGLGSSANYGHVKLSDALDLVSNSTHGIAATPYAARTAHQKGIEALEVAKAKKRTCVYVVGTRMNGHTSNDCDYLCDGVADEVEINIAIRNLPDCGGEVVLLEGTYTIENIINIARDNVILSGTKATVSIKNTNIIENLLLIDAVSIPNNITVQGINFVVNTVSGTNVAKNGIRVHGSNVKIRDCAFSKLDRGINVVNGSAFISCDKNDFSSCRIGISGTADSFIITDNVFNKTTNVSNSYGVFISDSNNLSISKNLVYNQQTGIKIYSNSLVVVSSNIMNNNTDSIQNIYSEHTNIIGNAINSTNYAIYCDGCDNNTIADNTVYYCTGSGITLTSCKLTTVVANSIAYSKGGTWSSNARSIVLSGSLNFYNLCAYNLIYGKNYISEGGSGNTFTGNKYN